MADYPRAPDDLLLDGIVTKVKAAAAADAALYPALAYKVVRDKTSPWQDLSLPLVNCEEDTDTPDRRDYAARYTLRLFVPTVDDDEMASARLAILKEQVRSALLGLKGYDFGLAVGDISIKSRPSWRRIEFDDAELNTTILAGEWSLEITYAYEPKPLDGPALSEISVNILGRFAALYHLGGE